MNTPPSKIAVVLVQRQTVDWQRLSDEAFLQQSQGFCTLWGKPKDYVWQLFQLWNQTFSVDYRVVRQRLKDISLQNFQSAHNLTFVPFQGYRNLPQQRAYYLFLDDDDWVDPQISDCLQQQIDPQDPPPLLLWRAANIGSPNQEYPVFVWGMNGRCMTNNYAVHSTWLQPFSKINHVIQHKDATALFEALPKNDQARAAPHLDCALTVSNKSPISSVSLDRGLNGDLCPEKLVALVENYIRRMQQVEDKDLAYIPWCAPLLDKTTAVFVDVIKGKK